MSEHPEWKNLGKEQLYSELVTLENCANLPFLSRVIQEAMRFEPVVKQSSQYDVQQEFTIGKYTFRKGDKIIPYIEGLHHNANQW